MKIPLLTIITGLIFICSCTEEAAENRKEKRLIGIWKFHKASYIKNEALFANNVLNDYKGDLITFNEDRTATYYDKSLDAEFEGNWNLEAETYYDEDEGRERIFYLDMDFYDTINEEDFSYNSTVSLLTYNKMTISFSDQDGEFTFKFRSSSSN